MANTDPGSWYGLPGSIGYHLKQGARIVAHAWQVRGLGFFSFMHEGDKENLPPVHSPYPCLDEAKRAAEMGGRREEVPRVAS
jgi:hypothetical protein